MHGYVMLLPFLKPERRAERPRLVAILAGVVIVLSGLALWKPVQLQELTALFGGYEATRYVHFFAMAAIVGFLVIHVVLALVVPKSLRAMITGR